MNLINETVIYSKFYCNKKTKKNQWRLFYFFSYTSDMNHIWYYSNGAWRCHIFKCNSEMGNHIWLYVLFSICFEILSSNHSVSMRENMAANSSWWWKDSMGTSRWNTWTPSLTNNSIFYKSLHRISGRGF